jgi:hypothetical protein
MVAVLILAIIFGFVGFIVKMGLDHKNARLMQHGGGGENSLRVSELQGLIREAVEEATAPLEERQEALETRVDEQEAYQHTATTETLLLDNPSARK